MSFPLFPMEHIRPALAVGDGTQFPERITLTIAKNGHFKTKMA